MAGYIHEELTLEEVPSNLEAAVIITPTVALSGPHPVRNPRPELYRIELVGLDDTGSQRAPEASSAARTRRHPV